MKLRIAAAAAALLAVAGLTACSSSTNGKGGLPLGQRTNAPVTQPASTSDSGSAAAPSGETTAGESSAAPPTATGGSGGGGEFCIKLQQAQTKLGQIGDAMSDPASAKSAIDAEAAVFSDLERSAPEEIKPAIHDLATVLKAAGDAFTDPGAGTAGALSDLIQKLPEDARKIGDYVAANCG
ncbi:hypothetical protein M6B22_11605 [Jatrophihabitans cynanchi]|jgi:hypothetical protein|uniref:Lipoprotein n=1 Tax=Jatrophihabitans cynanchi TaxID=2944128 RepID=A0ABY7JS93_9ACTN|nr:hypothetical protein [Jatrophihabitans sp. SB3-54]WAX55203.1 hypothetical protein M6B22_11605 [Jatrophihabitans sp. SB3-54]